LLSGFFCVSFSSVDHPCEKCGAVVEDGRAFCPQCRAPQITVQIAAAAEAVPEQPSRAGDGAETPTIRAPQVSDFAQPQELPAGLFNQRAAVKAAIWAGCVGSFIGIIPVIGIVLTGALAVYLYRREARMSPAASMGARLGGAAGIVLFAVNAVFIIPIIVMHAQRECIDALTGLFQKFGIDTTNAQFQASIGELFTPVGLLRSFVIAVVLAAVGGAFGAMMMREPPGR
jgi:hypothetical protein